MDTNETINKMNEATGRMENLQESAKAKISDVSNKLVDRSKAAATTTDAYVHEYAWSSVALAAVLGVLVGLMIRR